jgi:glycosyltransferase involved in cell wall biosynthesis
LHIDEKLKLTPRGLSPKMLLEHAGIAYNQMRSTYKVLKNVKPDVVCINAENILLSPAITRFFKVPCAIYVHGARFVELKKVGKLYFGLQKIARPTYLAVSKHVGDGLAELGVPKEQIKVVLNGVDLNKFHSMQADFSLRKEFNIPKKHSLVGTICHLTPRKGGSSPCRNYGPFKK